MGGESNIGRQPKCALLLWSTERNGLLRSVTVA